MQSSRFLPASGAVKSSACEVMIGALAVCGVEAIIAALGNHREDVVAQRNGCGALGELAKNAATNARIAEAGGVEAVVAALRGHREDVQVQFQGCFALANLAVDTANHARIAKAGGVEAVVAALRGHRVDAPVLFQGCRALATRPTLARSSWP